jgi:hypothetical protein
MTIITNRFPGCCCPTADCAKCIDECLECGKNKSTCKVSDKDGER